MNKITQTSRGSPTVDRVMTGQLCAGCGLCAGVSDGGIAMSMAEPGYARPTVTGTVSKAIEQKIAAACPGASVAQWQKRASLHPYWGPYQRAMTGHATDEEIRFAGSSGGLLSALALFALTSGRVDAIAHIRADPDQPTRNILTISRDRAGILSGAGSRYSASSPLSEINALLAGNDRIAFIGKPCDISALRQLGALDNRVADRIPLMFSFFCGGMPSLAGTDRVIEAMGIKPAEVVSFRYRGMGWPGVAKAETKDGRVATMSYADSWGGYLSKEVQFRCKVCPDAVGGVADIACADAWFGDEGGYPKFDEADGRSLALTRSEAGNALLQDAFDAGVCVIEPCPIAVVDNMQPGQVRRKRVVLARTAAAKVLMQPLPRMSNLSIWSAARKAPLTDLARNFLGTARRIIIGRR